MLFLSHHKAGPLLAVAVALLSAVEAFARAGGGHSYSGKSRSHSVSGGGGHIVSGGSGYHPVTTHTGGSSGLLSWLFRHPFLIISILIICVVCYFVFFRSVAGSGSSRSDLTPGAGHPPPMELEESGVFMESSARASAVPALAQDHNFSYPLFLDFVSALAQRSLAALHTPALANLEPYVSAQLFARFPAGVLMKNVVVGAVRINRMETSGGMDRIFAAVSFCATEVVNDRKQSFWYESSWHFSRQAGVVSKGPDEMLKLACPSCGSTSDKDASGACAHCGAKPAPGSEAWMVTQVAITTRESRPPVDLGSYAEEQGTLLPTVFSPSLQSGLVAIAGRDHGFSVAEAEKTFRRVFVSLQEAWSNRDLLAIRPLVTDQLYRVYSYWIEAYRSAGLRNVISGIQITSVEVVAAAVDTFYDSVTVRIAASMVDRCVSEGGKVAGGSESPRAFSEYWTFVRVAGGKGEADSGQTCSGCGATLRVGMTGECPYCGMVVSGKTFDWVLSRIDQDEDYGA